MVQATFSYEGINLRAIFDEEEDIQWLEEFLLPWFDNTDSAPDIVVRVTYNTSRFALLMDCGPGRGRVNTFMMDTRIVDFPNWDFPGDQLALYDESRQLFYLVTDDTVELVLRERSLNARLSVMRVLRELAMGVAQLTGGRFLHASAFELNGKAAIITGPRHAGKTSLLSYVLLNSKASFLTNDRLLLMAHGTSVGLRGMPTIVSIRDGTLDLFPGMRQKIIDGGFTSGATLREARQRQVVVTGRGKEGRHGISPQHFCSLLDCEPQRDARGVLLIFPRQTRRDGDVKLRHLEISEAKQRLAQCLFGHIGPDRLSGAFTRLPPRLSRKAPPGDESFCSGLANSLHAYECELGNQAYVGNKGVQQLLHLLENLETSGPAGATPCRHPM